MQPLLAGSMRRAAHRMAASLAAGQAKRALFQHLHRTKQPLRTGRFHNLFRLKADFLP